MRSYLRSAERLYSGSGSGSGSGSASASGSNIGDGMKDGEICVKRRVFVHCKAGRGRSVCLVLCYYLVLEAEALLRRAQKTRQEEGLSTPQVPIPIPGLPGGSAVGNNEVIQLNVLECFAKIQKARCVSACEYEHISSFSKLIFVCV